MNYITYRWVTRISPWNILRFHKKDDWVKEHWEKNCLKNVAGNLRKMKRGSNERRVFCEMYGGVYIKIRLCLKKHRKSRYLGIQGNLYVRKID